MIVVEKNEGIIIAYETSGTKLFMGDDELMLNLSKYQRDWPVHIDICTNRDGMLVIGTGDGLYYIAQLDIPVTQYSQSEESNSEESAEPLPLDMETVILTLWSTDTLTPSPIE